MVACDSWFLRQYWLNSDSLSMLFQRAATCIVSRSVLDKRLVPSKVEVSEDSQLTFRKEPRPHA